MRLVLRCIRAEYLKNRRAPLPVIYILVPVLGAFIFAAYYQISAWNVYTKVSAYLEVLAAAFPFLIGIIVGMVVQTENQAGHFQLLLGILPSRAAVYIGKVGMLIANAIVAVVLALGIFRLLYQEAPPALYVRAGCLLMITALPIYLIHLFVGMNYGKGASMGLGIVGSLLAALMITGLGDNAWNYIPWGWGVRAMDYLVLAWKSPELYAYMKPDFLKGMWICAGSTLGLFAAGLLWFHFWEGGKHND